MSFKLTFAINISVHISLIVLGFIGATLCCELGGVLGSHKIFVGLFINILRVPQTFFDVTPQGRILDRLANDIYILDTVIPPNIRVCCTLLFRVGWRKSWKSLQIKIKLICILILTLHKKIKTKTNLKKCSKLAWYQWSMHECCL